MKYGFEVEWYNEFDEDENDDYKGTTDYGIVFAEDLSSAIQKINNRFPEIIYIKIETEQTGDINDFVFLSKEEYSSIMKSNFF